MATRQPIAYVVCGCLAFSVVSVPSDMLTAGVEYVFEVSGVDFAGRGGTANTTVSVSLLPTPKVELLVPSKLTVYRAQATELRVTASAATGCSGVAASYNIRYSWTQTAGDALSLPSTSVDKRVATIPALTLQVGSTYTFRCTVSMVSNPSLSAYVDVHIVSVLSSPLRPVVSPLAAESAINQPLALDARASYVRCAVMCCDVLLSCAHTVVTCVQPRP